MQQSSSPSSARAIHAKVHNPLQDRKQFIAQTTKNEAAKEEVKALVIADKNSHNYKVVLPMPPTVSMSAQQLEEEVVKQLSKDSYGVVQVPISKEVLTLLSAQQERIKEQEKQIIEFKTKLTCPPMSARLERNSRIEEFGEERRSQRSEKLSYDSSEDAYQTGYQADAGTDTRTQSTR